jgi:hypothetical protein
VKPGDYLETRSLQTWREEDQAPGMVSHPDWQRPAAPPPPPERRPARPPVLGPADAAAPGRHLGIRLSTPEGRAALLAETRQIRAYLKRFSGAVRHASPSTAWSSSSENSAALNLREAINSPSLIRIQDITFGHGDRHVSEPDRAREEILEFLPPFDQVSGPFWGITPYYIYRAFPLADGRLHVGTYYDR